MNTKNVIQYTLFYYLIGLLLVGGVILISSSARKIPDQALPVTGPWLLLDGIDVKGRFEVPFYFTGDTPEDFARGNYNYTGTVNFSIIPEEPLLVLPYTLANGLIVEVNGVRIGSAGDPVRGDASRWNTSHLFPMPREVLSEHTTVTLRLYGLYEVGVQKAPYFLNKSDARLRIFLLYVLNALFIPGIIGALLILAMIFFLSSRGIDSKKKPRLFLSIALVGLSVYLLDYSYIPQLPVEYYIFKKISLTGLYLAIFFSIPGFFGYLGKALNTPAKIVMALPALAIFIIILFPDTMLDVRRVYKFANLSVFPYILLMHAAVFSMKERNRRMLAIIAGLTFLTLIALRDIVIVLLGRGDVILTHYGVVVFMLTLTFAFIDEMIEYYSTLIRTKRWADMVYADSMQDPLTGALNRKIFEVFRELNPKNFAVIILDMDDFKPINDEYGHDAGDRVLKSMVTTIKRNIRKTDYIVRLGGDEFAVVLFKCDLKTAKQTADMLHRKLSEVEIAYGDVRFPIRCSFGVGTVESAHRLTRRLAEIDSYMYRAKKSGKNRIVAEDEPVPVTAKAGN